MIKEHEPLPSYILSIVISIEVFFIFLESGFFRNISPEDTRYFLSALAQVEGAIIAIYLTMMLVGVQLTLKEYSEVVLDVYRKNREFWLVFISYVTSIVLTLTLLQNGETLNPFWLHLVYLWGIFNLVILPLFIYDSFMLFNPKLVIDQFLKLQSLTMEKTNLWTIYKIASRSIHSQNVEATAYLLEKIETYVRNVFSNKLKATIRKIELLLNKSRLVEDNIKESNKESNDEEIQLIKETLDNIEEFELMMEFIETLTHVLRALALYTIDQFRSNRISQSEAIWILNMIEPIFRIIFANFMYLYSIYSAPATQKTLEHSLSQCLLDLELIIERLQETPPEIREDQLGRFIGALPYNFAKVLRDIGYEDIAERAKRLQELEKEKTANEESFISI